MLYYVLDTSIILPTYTGKISLKDPKSPTEQEKETIECNKKRRRVFEYLLSQWIKSSAVLIVPNIVVSEVINFFARIHFRNTSKTLKEKREAFEKVKNKFIEQIKYSPETNFVARESQDLKKWFFNYELNRHHILNLDKILPIEHTTAPLVRRRNQSEGKISLSSHDLLIISVALELEVLMGKERVFLVTADKRMCKVCSNERLPTCYFADAILKPTKQLPKIRKKDTIYSPQPDPL